MQVKKRSGKLEKLNLNNIQKRLSSLAKGLDIQTDDIALRASQKMFDGVETREIDEQLAKNTVNYSIHPDYNVLAGRICVSALHKETAIGQLLEDEKQLLEKILLSGKVLEEENKYIQKLKNSLYDDPDREKILERYLKGQKVSKENLSFLAKAPRFFKTVELLYVEGDILEFQKRIDDKNTDEKTKIELESLVNLLKTKLSGQVLDKTERKSFEDYIKRKQDPKEKNHFGIINHRVYNVARENRQLIEDHMDYNRDFMFDFFGFKTLEKAYLLKSFKVVNKVREITEDTGEVIKKYVKETVGSIVERPQDTFMRVALAINGDNSFKRVFELYDLLSNGYYTHATPTLFNAGLNREQMSSCFLLANKSDSIDGIFETYKEEAEISKNSGGIGVWYHNVRSNGSHIKGTNGTSGGIIPFLTIKNAIARSIDQGGKRKGSIAVYLEPWHADVKDFIQLRKNTGIEEKRTRNLFLALWIPNLFYKRVEQGGKWSLFDPATAPGLHDLVGEAFEKKYEEYEKLGLAIETLDAREFFKDIFEVQIETGVPYILNKDYANMKSNQQNLGVIKSSNLCCVSGSQRVPTNKGYKTVKDLYKDKQPNIVVGREKLEIASEMFLPRPNTKIFTIRTSDGFTHEVTPDHKVWVKDFGWKEAQDLKEGDLLSIQSFEGVFGKINKPNEAFIAGLVAGDGTFQKDKNMHIDVWNENQKFLTNIEEMVKEIIVDNDLEVWYRSKHKNNAHSFYKDDIKPSLEPKFTSIKLRKGMKYRMSSSLLYQYFKEKYNFYSKTKLQVPEFVWQGNKETVVKYLEGLFYADGTITKVNKAKVTSMVISSTKKEFLEQLQLLLINLGIKSSIRDLHKKDEMVYMPDGKGGKKKYKRSKSYRLMITSKIACKMLDDMIGLTDYRGYDKKIFNRKKAFYKQKFYTKFISLDFKGIEDAYCLSVDSEEHSWSCNGLITKNTEIIEYSDEKETAVCNLASLCLPKFVKKDENGEWYFDHEELHKVTSVATYNLNRVIDKNYYVNDATERSNMRHRPIGLGVQGLADVFFKMRIRYDSLEAQKINEEIFETIYHAAVTESLRLAKRDGHYTSMKENGGAPITKGILQFDMWEHTPSSGRYEWDKVKEEVKTHGLRNSLLVAPMPTASTSQIFNNTESFEPLTEHLYKRKTLSGEFVVANKYLIRHLEELGLWGDEVVEHLINENGSIKNLKIVPEEVRDIYPTVWELSLKVQIDMAADRGAYICQSQSFNVHMDSPSMERMKDVYMYSWKKKLKTQSYYFRTNAATTNQKVTVKRQSSQAVEEDDDCEVCGS